MTPEQLTALAPYIGLVVVVLVGLPFFLKSYRQARERRQQLAEKIREKEGEE